jgi:hypothetical protein
MRKRQIQENAAFLSEGFLKAEVFKEFFVAILHGMNVQFLRAVGDRKQMSGITNSKNQTFYLGFVGVDDRRGDYQQKGPFQTESEVD